jgi:ATP-dependent DNA helicase RecQ
MIAVNPWHALVRTHAALATPRQQARFLCGLSSPATTAAKLTKHQWCGALAQWRFADVLTWCEQRTASTAAGYRTTTT